MIARRKFRVLRFARREVLAKGLPRDFWRDLYHQSMTASWPLFIFGVALTFVVTNGIFAGLFAIGTDPVANVPSGSFLHLFFFSVETLATVGYGDMHPQSMYGHVIASIEMFAGLIFAAVITGLIFARFSRPRARLIFANVATIGRHDGQRVLCIRVANARLNLIANAKAKMWVVMNVQTVEEEGFRRFYPLRLLRDESPVFTLSWTIFHAIDEASPLWKVDSAELEAREASFILTVEGRDESFAQTVQGRQIYASSDLRWEHVYVDIIETRTHDRLILDHHRFHDTRPQQGEPMQD